MSPLPLLLFLATAGPAPAVTTPDERSALERDRRGWQDILPGRGLAGWTRIAPISTRGVKSVVHPDRQVWVVNRKARPAVLECRGHLPAEADAEGKVGSHEMLRHDKEVGDFVFHVEWRFLDRRREGWNAGVYARVRKDAAVWHQAQVGGTNAGYWFGDTPDASGQIVRVKVDAREQRVKPAGEWNTYEITGRAREATTVSLA